MKEIFQSLYKSNKKLQNKRKTPKERSKRKRDWEIQWEGQKGQKVQKLRGLEKEEWEKVKKVSAHLKNSVVAL